MLFIAFAFLAGSIPFGVLVARRRGVDIQQRGSGNIGATNVARVLGKAPALLVLLLDAGKAAVPTYLALWGGQPQAVVAAVAFAAIVGHCFSPWLRFRGGKGVACAIGVYLVISPTFSAIVIGAFVAVLAVTRVPALGSAVGVWVMAVLLTLYRSPPLAALGLATAALILFTHRSNWRHLLARRAAGPGGEPAPPAA
ncbi:MAG: glycerol-3-phosphate acyltransferase [Myxococcales bacterium]|nr:glycerol-3-phosphate acyltransferase [Myxococcales bacterium]